MSSSQDATAELLAGAGYKLPELPQETAPSRDSDGFGAALRVQLGEDALEVSLHSALLDVDL